MRSQLGLIAIAAIGFYRRWAADRDACDGCLIVGGAVTVLGFFLIAGPPAIAPHFERYAICLIAPTTLLLARGALWWMTRPARCGLASRAAFAAVCVTLLASFYSDYFLFIDSTGGNSHRTFRTAAVEPKRQAWRYISEHSQSGRPVHIVTDEWWSYWPLAYLAGGQSNVQVEMLGAQEPGTKQELTSATPVVPTGEAAMLWRVEFATPDRALGNAPDTQASETPAPVLVINDYAGRPVLQLFGPSEKISQNY